MSISPYKIAFAGIAWESPMPGVRHRIAVVGDTRDSVPLRTQRKWRPTGAAWVTLA